MSRTPAMRTVHPEFPTVSVIVPAYNEERLIGRTLQALNEVDYPKDRIEVVVVDNGSTDRTAEVAREHGATVVVHPSTSVAGLRNLGSTKSSGDVLAFLDADCVPSRDWLQHAIASLRLESCVTGARVALPDAGSWVEKAWFTQPPQGRMPVQYINSGNLIVERAVFERLSGFNERLISGEDSDFCRRASALTGIIADDRIRAVHLGNPKTALQFLKREIWHGMGAFSSSGLTSKNKPLLGTVALVFLSFLQIAGIFVWSQGGTQLIFLSASAGIVALVLLSAFHRMRSAADPRLALQVCILFYLYYLGRATALARLLFEAGSPGRSR